MSQAIAILGRQPALGLAELESLYGADSLRPLTPQIVLIDRDPADIDFNRLGGTVKLAKLLTILDFTDWKKLSAYIVEHVPKHTCCIGPGKLIFGISTYGVGTNEKAIERTALEVKKAVRKSDGRPVRVVPTKGMELSSAQILHNKMTQPELGMELVFIRHGNQTYLAQTTNIQDIDAYAARDQARPKRDAKVGMLPPKLAQIIINLAKPADQATLLDPFCGTGVILQEASLMGLHIEGSDLDERMIDYTHDNLVWLSTNPRSSLYGLDSDQIICQLAVGDATSFSWSPVPNTVACETYLGRPFSAEPDPRVLDEVMRDTDTIHRKFLKNLAKQTESGFRACIAVPAWHTKNGVKHLRTLDSLEDLGYTRMSFVHARSSDLVYHRSGQVVGRELVVITRK